MTTEVCGRMRPGEPSYNLEMCGKTLIQGYCLRCLVDEIHDLQARVDYLECGAREEES